MTDSIVSTNNVWPYYSASNVRTAAAKGTETLGKDQFLSLLITQLQNQDPTNPMQDQEFIAQMATFSSLEQIMNISEQLKTMQEASVTQSLGYMSGLIGKDVSWIDSGDSNQIMNGVVDSIIVRDGMQYAAVGDLAIPVNEIFQVQNPLVQQEPEAEDSSSPGSSDSEAEAVESGDSL